MRTFLLPSLSHSHTPPENREGSMDRTAPRASPRNGLLTAFSLWTADLLGFFNLGATLMLVEDPANGAKFSPGSTVTLTVQVTRQVITKSPVQGAVVKIFIDGTQVCSVASNTSGTASCTFKATQSAYKYLWYATATLRRFTAGRSGNSEFTTTQPHTIHSSTDFIHHSTSTVDYPLQVLG